MLNGVRFTIKMVNDPSAPYLPGSSTATNTSGWFPTIWHAVDHDDGNPVSITRLQAYTHVRHSVMQPNREVVHFFKPTTLTQIGTVGTLSSATGQAINFKPVWLNWANNLVPHNNLVQIILCGRRSGRRIYGHLNGDPSPTATVPPLRNSFFFTACFHLWMPT